MSEVATPEGAFEPGAIVGGKWRIQQSIASGNMGRVYQALDLTLQRPVALKVISVDSDEHRARMEREAKLLAKLDHPNIVPIFAFGQAGSTTYLVMKKLEGRTLRDLAGEGQATQADLLNILRQVASGLDHVHNRGLIHRDVKPSNIMIGFDGRATLVDFGISRELAGAKDITREGCVVATMPFASPEMLSDPTEVDHRVDIYALAVTAYRMLFATAPFEGESDFAQLRAKLAGNFRLPSTLGFSPSLDGVFARALSPKPDGRHDSCTHLVEDLALALEDPLTVQNNRKPKKKVVKLAAAALVAGCCLAVGLLAWRDEPNDPAKPVEVATAPAPAPAVVPAAPSVPSLPQTPEHVAIAPVDQLASPLNVETETPALQPKSKPPSRTKKPSREQKLRLVIKVKGESSWGQVVVDGRETKQAPCLITLPPGKHSLVVEHPGYKPQRRDVVAGSMPELLEFSFD
jgi:serine/threonine protein kinase